MLSRLVSLQQNILCSVYRYQWSNTVFHNYSTHTPRSSLLAKINTLSSLILTSSWYNINRLGFKTLVFSYTRGLQLGFWRLQWRQLSIDLEDTLLKPFILFNFYYKSDVPMDHRRAQLLAVCQFHLWPLFNANVPLMAFEQFWASFQFSDL